MTIEVRKRNRLADLAEACADDFPRLCFDGFGVMLSTQQEEFQRDFGHFGPRTSAVEPKFWWLSGGQRAGKTVIVSLLHADACLYKRGLDPTDRLYWRNYAYGTLAIAPIEQLALRLYLIMDELAKGANNAQWDGVARRSRGGAFLSKMKAGKAGIWPIVRFSNGAFVDFRSSEGRAYRLEGGQWWGCSWDEWASQPDREIEDVVTDVLPGRLRDHDAKLLAMAWPKPETEHHLIKRIREIEKGKDTDSRVAYLAADEAHFTNQQALDVERRMKGGEADPKWMRTVLGRPAGGAAIEFKIWMLENAKIEASFPELPQDGYRYFNSWDLGLGRDSTVGGAWRIPVIGGRGVVSPNHKARLVGFEELKGGTTLTLDTVTYRVAAMQHLYRAQSAVDATGLGGLAAVRQLRDMKPPPLSFTSRSNDRIHGNMRLAAITNALDMMTWGRPDQDEIAKHSAEEGWEPAEYSGAWGLVELPDVNDLQELFDQLLNFDRDAKDQTDDAVWMFLIGCWYIRRYWVSGSRTDHVPQAFAPPGSRGMVRNVRRSRLIGIPDPDDAAAAGTRLLGPLPDGRPRVLWSRSGRSEEVEGGRRISRRSRGAGAS